MYSVQSYCRPNFTTVTYLVMHNSVTKPRSCYNLKSLEWDKGQTLVLEKLQENLIESFLQSSLSYIPIQMVCANYCAPYPKWPCVKHEVNMCYPCCMMSLFPKPSTSFSQVPWSMLWPHHQMWLMWQCDQSLLTLTPRVLKIEKCKIIEKEMKRKK